MKAKESFDRVLAALGDGDCAHFLVRVNEHIRQHGYEFHERLLRGKALSRLARFSEARRYFQGKCPRDIANFRRYWLKETPQEAGPVLAGAAMMEASRCEAIGDLYAEKGDWASAIRWYQRALGKADEEGRRNPARAESVRDSRASLHFQLGYFHWTLGSWREARRHLRLVLASDPSDFWEARYALGVVYRSEGHYARAARWFEEVQATEELEELREASSVPRKLDRDSVLALSGSVAWTVGAPRYLRHEPEDWEVFFQLITHLQRLFRFQKAHALLRSVERRKASPPTAELWSQRAYVFKNQSRYRAAAHWFRRAAELEPQVADHWLGQGSCEARLGNFELAERLLRRALPRERAYYKLGLVMRSQERFHEACSWLESIPDYAKAREALLDVRKAIDFLTSPAAAGCPER